VRDLVTGDKRRPKSNYRPSKVVLLRDAEHSRNALGGHRTVEGTTKSDRVRRIALDAATVDWLRARRVQQFEERLAFGEGWRESDEIWTWEDGSGLHPNHVSAAHKRLARKAGLPPLSVHKLRHGHASHSRERGVPVEQVSRRLGHSSVFITSDLYVRPSDEADAEAAELVANLYAYAQGAGDPATRRPTAVARRHKRLRSGLG